MEDSGNDGRRQGFLALPRGILSQGPDAWFPGDFRTACIYAALVNEANWRDGFSPLPRQRVPLKVGQLLLRGGQRDWADRHGFSRQALRTSLAYLRHNRKINPETNPHGTIITIIDYVELFLNWTDDQPTDQPAGNPRLTLSRQERQERQEPPPLIPPSGGTVVGRKIPALPLPAGQSSASDSRASDKLRRRRARDQAKRWVDKATGAARRSYGALQQDERNEEARQSLEAIERSISYELGNGWLTLIEKFVTWSGFCWAYFRSTHETAYATTKVHTFEAQLRETFTVSLLEQTKLLILQGGQ